MTTESCKTTYVRFNSHGCTNAAIKAFDGVYAFQPAKQGTAAFVLKPCGETYTVIPSEECNDTALYEDALLLAAYHVAEETRKPFNKIIQYGTLKDSPDNFRVSPSTTFKIEDLEFLPTTWPTVDDQLVMAAILQQQYPEQATVLLFLASLPDCHPLARGKPFSWNTSSEEQLD